MHSTREAVFKMKETILSIKDLRTYFFTRRGVVRAVDGVDFDLIKGECLCLVGESGCGKTVAALSILSLIDSPPGKVVSGEIDYNGIDLLTCPPDRLASIKGKEIAMAFQDAQSALNPVFTIGDQITEPIRLHLKLNNKEAKNRTISLLKEVGMASPERVVGYYPHQLSGGMRQRAMIAMSLSCKPQILIADEPTTAVDVTIKAQILDIFRRLKAEREMSLIFITHELNIVSEIGDRVAVMYAGRLAELADTAELLNSPKHPYTVGLIDCLPDIHEKKKRLRSIPGTVPNLIDPLEGCLFHPRCSRVMPICRELSPPAFTIGDGHKVFCHLYA